MLIIHNISSLVTVRASSLPRFGQEMDNVEIIEDGYIVIENGKFIEIGSGDDYLKYKDAKLVSGKGKTVTPGLIDCHTHLVHAGSRENEFKLKLEGVDYLEILKQGGGILSTVEKTRLASFEELYNKAKKSLDIMLSYGTTTVEAKSGYGLDVETEVKQMEVANRLNIDHPVNVISTFMGAHALPNEYKDRREEYIQLMKELITKVKYEDLAKFVDVFCEEGVFSIAESREILEYAKTVGLDIKIHADEIHDLGGAKLASELGCISAEHLLASNKENLIELAKSKVIAVMLPLTSFNLNKDFFKARFFIENNGALAIATDYNPGSSPSENIQLAMQVASIKAKLTPKEVITAVTINAASALGINEEVGSIEEGKVANFVIFDSPNLEYIFYHFGINHVESAYINGKLAYINKTSEGVHNETL
ncbi:MAG TPA: imidazolonepropionase [Acholeplasmataceae bacterium]|nr:imidazolonepropionase [Acholeplasmataceae bacterium]